MSTEVSVHTNPAGADVYMKAYMAFQGEWQHLGRSPIERVRVPRGYFRWRVTKQGFQAIEVAASTTVLLGYPRPNFQTPFRFTLDKENAAPTGMVRVMGGKFRLYLTGFGHYADRPPLDDYFIDKYEVTNKQFKRFVDSGGYQKREYWKHPFLKNGRHVSWEQAMSEFRDSTGRPGPAAWEVGDYPKGQDDLPVTGVSWYEAAAYAEFVGKTLPTIYHWAEAAGIPTSPFILPLSNFGGAGPAPSRRSGQGRVPRLARYRTDRRGNQLDTRDRRSH